MNKRGSLGLAFIPSIFLIALILFFHMGLSFGIFSVTKLESGVNINLAQPNLDLSFNKQFLDFLRTKVIINGNEEKIIDTIKFSLEPYFEIKNEDGENFIEAFGFSFLTGSQENLRNRMDATFPRGSWQKYVTANEEFKDGEGLKQIIFELDKLCELEAGREYLLELPQGIVTPEGLKTQDYLELVDLKSYTMPVVHLNALNGEKFEIKFRLHRECLL